MPIYGKWRALPTWIQNMQSCQQDCPLHKHGTKLYATMHDNVHLAKHLNHIASKLLRDASQKCVFNAQRVKLPNRVECGSHHITSAKFWVLLHPTKRFPEFRNAIDNTYFYAPFKINIDGNLEILVPNCVSAIHKIGRWQGFLCVDAPPCRPSRFLPAHAIPCAPSYCWRLHILGPTSSEFGEHLVVLRGHTRSIIYYTVHVSTTYTHCLHQLLQPCRTGVAWIDTLECIW